ncbi:MAG: BCD family MFS transporter [Chloroflexi bacterium]|nr:BCD family MFS transporter [Chloroflexota bacterium]MCI0575843.1 BCD family MFS transporter [Chloroflexota bacterium]MCI0646570.1 BCD family MFS transporter [Chloroflexota bacterium]MCI0726372.1 BCD family MFS transporter [Chloroflexota bacterium]
MNDLQPTTVATIMAGESPAAVSTQEAAGQSGATRFNVWQTLRLSTFQIGSAMGDILVGSVWNRIVISDLGVSATIVGLLTALRYLLSPLALWAGARSDTRPIGGLHRTPYIWIGRSMYLAALPLLGFSLARLSSNTADVVGWALAVAFFLLYGIGTLLSGAPFLSLVRDSAPKEKQGLAISMAETALITFFPFVAVGFGRLLENYTLAAFWRLVLLTVGVGGFFWFFAVVGVEKKAGVSGRGLAQAHSPDFKATFQKIVADRRTRRFFAFLAVGTVAAWAQEAILEPFGAEALALPQSETTRMNAYWQGMTVLVLILGAVVWRRRRPEQQPRLAKIGLGIMAAGMITLALAALGAQLRLVQLGLVIFGAGFGLYTFGALSLMAVMTTDQEAGAYLGLWSVCILVSRGAGIALGGLARDQLLALTGSAGLAYGAIFVLEAVGLVAAALLLSQADILSFARDTGRLAGEEPAAGGLDLV